MRKMVDIGSEIKKTWKMMEQFEAYLRVTYRMLYNCYDAFIYIECPIDELIVDMD